MEVLLTATGPDPRVGVALRKGSVATLRTCKPDSKLFGAFVRALGTRYPTVKKWSIWNEPNLRSWLSPQYETKGSQAVQRSAYLYRQLADVGDRRPARDRAPRRPDLAGRDRAARRRPVRLQRPALAARAQEVRGEDPQDLAGDVPARRPLPEHQGQAADRRRGHRPALRRLQEAQRHRLRAPSVHARRLAPADLARQRRRDHDQRRLAPDAAARQRGQAQADPGQAADRVHRARLADQARTCSSASPTRSRPSTSTSPTGSRTRTRACTPSRSTRSSTTANIPRGLPDGPAAARPARAKPAYAAYKLPIWVSGKGANVTVYGQLRPADNGTAQTVDIQVAAAAGASFKTVAVGPRDLGERHLHRHGAQFGQPVAPVLERDHVPPGGGVA